MFYRCWSIVLLCAAATGTLAGAAHGALPEFSKNTGVKAELGAATFEAKAELVVTCANSIISGEITGPKTIGALKDTFKHCEVKKTLCTSSGATEGEVRSEPLSGEIGYLNSAKKEVGVRTESAEGKSAALAKFTCGTGKFAIKGAVIGSIAPVNTETTKFTLTQEGAKGVQALKKFEAGLEEVLTVEFIVTSSCDLNSSGSLSFNAPVTISA